MRFKKGEGDVSHTVSLYFRVAYGVYTAAKVVKLFLSCSQFDIAPFVRYTQKVNGRIKYYTIILSCQGRKVKYG